jgi:hypothetical protein
MRKKKKEELEDNEEVKLMDIEFPLTPMGVLATVSVVCMLDPPLGLPST